MNFQAFDAQLREDVHQIQMLASMFPTEEAQIDRIRRIAMAAAYCLAAQIGPRATGHVLHELAQQIEARGGDVH